MEEHLTNTYQNNPCSFSKSILRKGSCEFQECTCTFYQSRNWARYFIVRRKRFSLHLWVRCRAIPGSSSLAQGLAVEGIGTKRNCRDALRVQSDSKRLSNQLPGEVYRGNSDQRQGQKRADSVVHRLGRISGNHRSSSEGVGAGSRWRRFFVWCIWDCGCFLLACFMGESCSLFLITPNLWVIVKLFFFFFFPFPRLAWSSSLGDFLPL